MQDSDKPSPEMKQAPEAQPGQEQVKSADSGRPWILGMAGAVMLVVGLVIGSVIWSAPKMSPYVEPLLQTTSSGDFGRAYGMIGSEWRGVIAPQEFEQMHRVLHETMGSFVSLKQTDYVETDSPQLGKVAQVTFIAQFERGEVDVTAVLRETSTGWSLVGMGYASPLLDVARMQPESQTPAMPTPMPATQPAAP